MVYIPHVPGQQHNAARSRPDVPRPAPAIFDELDALRLIDPHTHINPLEPASRTLADILGYHYYTELAHSAGMPKEQIEQSGLEPREKVARLLAHLGPLENTVQFSWFLEIARTFFGYEGQSVGPQNCQALYEAAEQRLQQDQWPQQVLDISNWTPSSSPTSSMIRSRDSIRSSTYRASAPTTWCSSWRRRGSAAAGKGFGTAVADAASLRIAIAAYSIVSAPRTSGPVPSRCPRFRSRADPGSAGRNSPPRCSGARGEIREADQKALSSFVFWTLAEFCEDFRLHSI